MPMSLMSLWTTFITIVLSSLSEIYRIVYSSSQPDFKSLETTLSKTLIIRSLMYAGERSNTCKYTFISSLCEIWAYLAGLSFNIFIVSCLQLSIADMAISLRGCTQILRKQLRIVGHTVFHTFSYSSFSQVQLCTFQNLYKLYSIISAM